MINIRVEAGSLNKKQVTGVGYYTKRLIYALEAIDDVHVSTFTLESHQEDVSTKQPEPVPNHRVPRSQKLYRKLHQFGLASPVDKKLPLVDVTIFPDFAVWPTRRSKQSAVVIHDLTFIKHPRYMRARTIGGLRLPVTTWYLSSVVRRAVKDADFVITVSKSIKEDLMSLLGVKSDKIIVTPIPTSDDFLLQAKHTRSKEDLRQKYAIPTTNYILSVGTIEPRKNQLATLHAYLELPREFRRLYSLVFAGGYGWGSEHFLTEVEHAKRSGENVVLTGYYDFEDSYGLYHHSSLFTAASHYEGFGMPLMEAMSAGTPLLVADIPVFHEVAGSAAIYVNTADSQSYAKNIKSLLEDSGLRNRHIKRGLRRKDTYSWQINAKTLVEHFSQHS